MRENMKLKGPSHSGVKTLP